VTPQDTAALVAAAARSSLECLPETIRSLMRLYDVDIAVLCQSIGANAAQVIELAKEES
jgi:hypothetical protein